MSPRATSAPRVAALVALLGASSLLAGACRDLVVSEDVVDYAEALCAELRRCTGDDACTVGVALRAAESRPSVVQRYLEFAVDTDCLASCRDAKRCLDFPPVCRAAGQRCADDSDCCGASQRLGRCDSSASECCGELGAECTEASECCGGEACLPVGGGTETRCGGFECTTLGDSCGSNFECCSRRCEAGSCASSTCGSVGDTCTTADDCCIQNTPLGEQRLECSEGSCQAPGAECVGCDPLDLSNCCIANQSVCYEAIDGSSFCGQWNCSPLGVACASDGDCCPSDGAVCSRSGAPHCAKPCASVDELGCCRPASMECKLGAQCCSGSCIGGKCLESDVGCAPTTCHSPTSVGGPLDPGDERVACTSLPTWNADCIQTVCGARSRCCCLEWDFACATAFDVCTGP